MKAPDRELFIVNELTLLPFLYGCLTGHRPLVMAVLPLLRPAGGLLRRLVAVLTARGLCRPASAFSDQLRWSENMPEFGCYNEIHINVEAKLHAAFNPPPRGAVQAWYDYAARKAVTDFTADLVPAILLADWADRNPGVGHWRLRGAPALLAWLYQHALGRGLGFPYGRGSVATALFNLANLTAGLVMGVTWLLPRLRLRVVPQTCVLAVDAHTDLEATVLRRLVPAGARGVALFRSRAARDAMAPLFDGYDCLTMHDARVTPRRAVQLVLRLGRDLVAQWRGYGLAEPELFGRLCVLATKRCLWDAFFDGMLPANLWCRDDYSQDHPVRNKVLRDRGGRSLGINHGICINTYFYAYREIDCDVYFMHGTAMIPYYRDVWPAHMAVRAIGCVHQPPPDEAPMARSRDIVVFATVVEDLDWLMAQCRALAEHFSDRRVWLRTKVETDDGFMAAVDGLVAEGPANLVRNWDPTPYDLLRHCGYALSTGSTATLEAIAFGVPSFVFDVWPKWSFYYFRNFPEIITTDAADLIDRIGAIEDGSRPYRFAACEDLIRQGVDPFEEIRKEMTSLG